MSDAEPRELAPTPTHSSYQACKYFSSLDTFRFLAILGVIWHHTHEGFVWLPASWRGFLGVDFFFVISGFLIVTLLLRERDRAGEISLRRFYLRRALRIFPIYYAMLGTIVAYFLLLKPNSSMAGPFFANLPYQALYLSNFTVDVGTLFFTWSLATEEQFYLIWPPIERWARGLAVPLLLGVILVNQLINFGLLNPLFGSARYQLNILQITFTPICFGVLLAHVLHERRGFDRVARWLGRPWIPLVLLAATFLACNVSEDDLTGWPRLLIQSAMTLLLASCVIREDHWVNRLLSFRLVRRIGVISYGMYLYHEFVAHFVVFVAGVDPRTPPFAYFLLTLALTLVAADLSYRFYETPFLKLKDRLGHLADRREALERELERTS